MEQSRYHYNAFVTRVVDGDTIHCDIDLGFGVMLKDQIFRFYGLNAPETKGTTRQAGLDSKKFIENLLSNKQIIVVSIKDKKDASAPMNVNLGWIRKLLHLLSLVCTLLLL
jgi:micrococcal nuclease